ncbi:MAG: O-antigen ligase family protein [Bacteroidales bacterium]|nr:O-antigen ligase family protein [Bacteroidales bacterium]MCF8336529.1 O-antigen ligase family protein [Bacteroidales bacterium]
MGSIARKKTGADYLRDPIAISLFLLVAAGIGVFIANGGLMIAGLFIVIPFMLIYLNRLFVNPRIGLYSLVVAAFIAIGLTRYIPGNPPLGLSIDGLLALTFIAIFFKFFYKKTDLRPILNDLMLLNLIWFLYEVAEFFNPLTLNRMAWFYLVRGFSVYMLMTVPLTLILFNRVKYLYIFLYLWAFFSILVTLKGMMQLYIGPDFAEQRWLAAEGATTHVLYGKLRIFSFLSDAGQYGAQQGAAMVVGTILALHLPGFWNKVLFGLMGFLGFYGMMISGTRGAIIVPGVGLILYLIYTKNIRALIIGAILLTGVYSFFRFTYIGQGVAQIRRMRTAFRPQDVASLQVRLETRELLQKYLADKPFGGGIGMAGNPGKRFAPHGFLSTIATDSFYVHIWADQGIIGLFLYLFISFYIILKGSFYVLARLETEEIKYITGALIASIGGIMGASYGNGVFNQHPTGILIYMSMAFIFMSPWLDDEMLAIKNKNKEIFRKKEKWI